MNKMIYSTAQIKQWEDRWFLLGNPSFGLMQQAAWSMATWIIHHYSKQPISVMCGTGNNGGDGFLLALYLQQMGWSVQVWRIKGAVRGDAAQAMALAEQEQVPIYTWTDEPISTPLIVDAIFGIGLKQKPKTQALAAIDAINAAKKQGSVVIAVDVPSGVDADYGQVWEDTAVMADHTLCLLGLKSGLVTGAATNHVGKIKVLALLPPDLQLLAMGEWVGRSPRLPARQINSHKGTHGHTLLIGGDQSMAGAVLLAAESAARAGSGKITVVTRQEHLSAVWARDPNLMTRGLSSLLAEVEHVFGELFPKANSAAIGMGLGRGAWGQTIWQAALPYLLDVESLPAVVIDADALYHLKDTDSTLYLRNNSHWRCTPHSGEAAYLLDCQVSDIEANRYQAIRQLQQRYGGQWLLKGAGTVTLDYQGLSVCGLGNAGMAVGGMGDVLSGLMAGVLAQYPDTRQIDLVCLHAAAGDLAAKAGQRGMTALDVIGQIKTVVSA